MINRTRGEIIHFGRDALGSMLVIDYRKHRVLTFDTVFEQSKILRRMPHLPVHEYTRAMLLPVVFQEPQHATVLGLGGGVLVNALYQLLPECQLHAVELRPEVLDIAREYFSLPRDERLRVTIAEAAATLNELPDTSTDLVLADLYSASRMSSDQSRHHFIRQCRRVLSDEGCLVINYHRPPEQDVRFYRQLRGEFPALMKLQCKSDNTVIYASKRPLWPSSLDRTRLETLEARLPIGWAGMLGGVVQCD